MILTTAALTLLAALAGFRFGLNAQPLTETQAIEQIAARYVRETGGAATDCQARPGQGDIWLIVNCGAQTYKIDRKGQDVVPVGPST